MSGERKWSEYSSQVAGSEGQRYQDQASRSEAKAWRATSRDLELAAKEYND